jgi:hypothetical protein
MNADDDNRLEDGEQNPVREKETRINHSETEAGMT